MEKSADDRKQFFTRFGCVVAVFGVLAIMCMKVAEDSGVNRYTLSVINTGLLCFILFPALLVLLVIFLKDWMKQTISDFFQVKMEFGYTRDHLDGINYFPKDTFRKIGKNLQNMEANAVKNISKRVQQFTRTTEHSEDADENASLVTAVRENVRKGCSVIKNKLQQPSEKLAGRLSSLHRKPGEGERNEQDPESLSDFGEKTTPNRMGYDSFRQTLSTARKHIRNSLRGSLSTEEIFRRHFNLTSPSENTRKTHKVNDPQDAQSWFVFLKREGAESWDPQLEQIQSERNTSLLKDQVTLERRKSEINGNISEKTVSKGRLQHECPTDERGDSVLRSGSDKALDHEKQSSTFLSMHTADNHGSRINCVKSDMPENKEVEILKSDSAKIQVGKRNTKREFENVRSENGKSAIDDDGHDDSDSSKAALEELFRQYFGLQDPKTNVIEFKRINTDSRKSSQSWSGSLNTASTSKEPKTTNQEFVRSISGSENQDQNDPKSSEMTYVRKDGVGHDHVEENGSSDLQYGKGPGISRSMSNGGSNWTNEKIFRKYFDISDPIIPQPPKHENNDNDSVHTASTKSVVSHYEVVTETSKAENKRHLASASKELESDSMKYVQQKEIKAAHQYRNESRKDREIKVDLHDERLNLEHRPVDRLKRRDSANSGNFHDNHESQIHATNGNIRIDETMREKARACTNNAIPATYIDDDEAKGYESEISMLSGVYHGDESKDGCRSDATSIKMLEKTYNKDRTQPKQPSIKKRGSFSSLKATELSPTSGKEKRKVTKLENNVTRAPKKLNKSANKHKHDFSNNVALVEHPERIGEIQTSREMKNDPRLEITDRGSDKKFDQKYQDLYSENEDTITISNGFGFIAKSDADSISIVSSRRGLFTDAEENDHHKQDTRFPIRDTDTMEMLPISTRAMKRKCHSIEVDSEEERILLMIRRLKK